jgi:hypothetical protein
MTDTRGMKRIAIGFVILSLFAVARGGEPCDTCRGSKKTAAGDETPYGDTGCGPRYCGAKHDECWTPDPCDACARWRGCNGVKQAPEKFPPWQLPPGRGFQSGADVGYAAVACGTCGTSGACGPCQACGPRFRWGF